MGLSQAPLLTNHRYNVSAYDDVSNVPAPIATNSANSSGSSSSMREVNGISPTAEIEKMKIEIEKQRSEMQEREDKWIIEKNADKELAIQREKNAIAKRQKDEEERVQKEHATRVEKLDEERRRDKEREDEKREMEREEKRRDMEREDEKREMERENKRREIDMEDKADKLRKEESAMREERLAFERKKADQEKNVKEMEELDNSNKKEAIDSTRKNIVQIDIDKHDRKSEDGREGLDYSQRGEYEERSLAPPTASLTPKNIALRDSMGFRESVVERDSLDIFPDNNNYVVAQVAETAKVIARSVMGGAVESDRGTGREDVDLSGRLHDVSTEWVSTIERTGEDSLDSSLLVPSSRDGEVDGDRDGNGDTRMSGVIQATKKNLFGTISETSINSDEWSGSGSGSDDEHGYKKKESQREVVEDREISEGIGSVSHIANNTNKIKGEEDLKKEEDERIEIEKKMVADQLIIAEQKKKEDDMKAIQDARASVIARRKQKSERDAVAASLSALPPKVIEKPISVSASAPHTFAPSKYQSHSSSDESEQSEKSDRIINKSKSAVGVSLKSFLTSFFYCFYLYFPFISCIFLLIIVSSDFASFTILFVHLSVCVYVCVCVCPSVCLSV